MSESDLEKAGAIFKEMESIKKQLHDMATITPPLNKKFFTVYLIRDTYGMVKIGHTHRVHQRVLEISRNHALPLKLIALLDCEDKDSALCKEQALHEEYKHLRSRGEWFKLTEETISAFCRHMTENKRLFCEDINNDIEARYSKSCKVTSPVFSIEAVRAWSAMVGVSESVVVEFLKSEGARIEVKT